GESHRTSAVSSVIQIMIVVQHPERIKPFHSADAPVLPVKPPEIHSLLLSRMKDIFKACFEEVGIRSVEADRLFRLGINSHGFCHFRIHLLISADSVGGM